MVQEKPLTGGSSSNFVQACDLDAFEEEKVMRIDSINEVAHNFSEADQVTHDLFEAQAYFKKIQLESPRFSPRQLNSPLDPEPLDDELPVTIMNPMHIL